MWGTAALCGVGDSGGAPPGAPNGNPKGGPMLGAGVPTLGWRGGAEGLSCCSPGTKRRGDPGVITGILVPSW